MTGDASTERKITPRRVSQKDQVLLAHDLAMMATAGKYDLADKAEMNRSCLDLSRLFFSIAGILEIDLFVEAGAKDAASSRRARRLLDPKRIVAFEANPYTYRRFAKSNEGHGVEYEHKALSDEAGSVTFNVRRSKDGTPRADGQASLLKRADEVGHGFVEVTVEATTLDAHFAGYNYGQAAIWIDVEGAAQAVLGGSASLLAKAAIVIIEVEDRRYWGEEQWLRPDVVSFLYDCGLVPVARDFQSRYQYNIVFVRSGLLAIDRVRWAITLFTSAHQGPGADTGKSPSELAAPPRAKRPKLVTRALRKAGRLRSAT